MTNETNQLEYATKQKTKNICSKQTSHIKCRETHTDTDKPKGSYQNSKKNELFNTEIKRKCQTKRQNGC